MTWRAWLWLLIILGAALAVYLWLLSLDPAKSSQQAGAIQASLALVSLLAIGAWIKDRRSAATARESTPPSSRSPDSSSGGQLVEWRYRPLHDNPIDLWVHLDEVDREVSRVFGSSPHWTVTCETEEVEGSITAARRAFEAIASRRLPSRVSSTTLRSIGSPHASVNVEYPVGVTHDIRVLLQGANMDEFKFSRGFERR